MKASKQLLLVEGGADKSFFEMIIRKLSLNTTVKVAPPKEVKSDGFNTKNGLFNILKPLLSQLDDGQYTHIAAIVDSDYIEYDGGYQKTINKVSTIINPLGFELKESESNQKGLYFENSYGLADFGLWVMPDNQNEGMLEDWIKSCIKEDESPLFQQASEAVGSLSDPKFKDHLASKAEVATWLAWQEKPGHGLYGALNADLLDNTHPSFQALEQWLKAIYLTPSLTL